MESINKVFNNHCNIPRGTILVPLAISLGIDHKKFKNRKLLIEEIKKQCPASKRCENETDFATLQNIDEIPKSDLFIWSQHGKTFGADINSLKSYIDAGHSMNPWTIDYATGIENSKNRSKYLMNFDMKLQKGLIESILSFFENRQSSSSVSSDDILLPQPSKHVQNRFEIEKLGDLSDQYVTHIITGLESCDSRFFFIILSDTLQKCIEYFGIQLDFIALSIFQQLFSQNEIMKFNSIIHYSIVDTTSLLLELLQSFQHYHNITYVTGMMKYFFLSIEETMIEYRLLKS